VRGAGERRGLRAGALAAPLALRLPQQPLLGFLVQAIASCLWKPYPSVTDVALYLVRPQPTPVGEPEPGTCADTRRGVHHARKADGLFMTGCGL